MHNKNIEMEFKESYNAVKEIVASKVSDPEKVSSLTERLFNLILTDVLTQVLSDASDEGLKKEVLGSFKEGVDPQLSFFEVFSKLSVENNEETRKLFDEVAEKHFENFFKALDK